MSGPVAQTFDPVRGESEPGRVWTFTNIAEATPDILSPLCWSVWNRAAQETLLGSFVALGILAPSAVVVSPDQNQNGTGVIYGRQAFNLDVMRRLMSQMPGMSPDDFERDLLGVVRADAPTTPAAPLRRLPLIAVRAPYTLMKSPGLIERNHADTFSWWREEVLDVSRGAAPRRSAFDDLILARDRFARSFYLHSFTRYLLSGIQGAVLKAAEKIGDAALGTAAMSGQGGVTETELADDLWRVSRGELDVAAFIGRYGYRGPNEGNVYTHSWREQPDRVVAMAKSQSERPDLVRPALRSRQAAREARAAADRLLQASARTDRVVLRVLLARARNVIPRLELGKAAYVMPLDGVRAAARRLGAELVASGRLGEVDDVFFLEIDELRRLSHGSLPEARDQVAFRRAARETYRAMDLPVSFTGMPESVEASDPSAALPTTLTGAASGGGTVEGRARVVLDPNDDVDLDDGDILVCKFTDPSWAPLFTLANALVIDLGGAASHGAVVARELGIPYVIGTQRGTAIIRDGDRLIVDGTNNSVRIVR